MKLDNFIYKANEEGWVDLVTYKLKYRISKLYIEDLKKELIEGLYA